MEPSLEEGLNRLFGAGTATVSPPPPTTGAQTPATGQPGAPNVSQLAAQAQEQYRRAQDALRGGDFARYGEEIRRLEETLNALVQTAR
jgi:uncharacterized membrane protein (UPF0182 family)